jgi:hypothetical protein
VRETRKLVAPYSCHDGTEADNKRETRIVTELSLSIPSADGLLEASMQLFGETISPGTGAFLLIALAMALSFEFVNGFHDTASAVATVIYTRSLRPAIAVIWSGCWNLYWGSYLCGWSCVCCIGAPAG